MGFGAIVALAMVAVVAVVGFRSQESSEKRDQLRVLEGPTEPDEWMLLQRSTEDAIPPHAFERAVAQMKAVAAETAETDPDVAGAEWELVGPTNIGGRLVDIAVDPELPDTVYTAAATGGVWKSTDAGETFAPAWPDDLTQSMGALAMASDGTLYAGTGEPNNGGGSIVYGGTGIYRSKDRGETWAPTGLENSGAIGRIAVDPSDPDRVFVAAQGNLFRPGGQRGLYRSLDGGDTWELVLEGANDTTGATDVAIDPGDPERLYAAMWQNFRTPDQRLYAGVGSGVFRSTDGGDTWERMGADAGLQDPSPNVGRIGLAVASSEPHYFFHSGTRVQSADLLTEEATYDENPPTGSDTARAADIPGEGNAAPQAISDPSWTGTVAGPINSLTVDFWQENSNEPLGEVHYRVSVWVGDPLSTDSVEHDLPQLVKEVQAGTNPARITHTFTTMLDAQGNEIPLNIDPQGQPVTINISGWFTVNEAATVILYDSAQFQSGFLINGGALEPSPTPTPTETPLKRVYAIVAGAGSYIGFYMSRDGGDTWIKHSGKFSGSGGGSGFPWWFGRVWVHPLDGNHVFVADVSLWESTTEGLTWRSTGGVHVDHHAMAWDLKVPGRVYEGNDGGFYRSDSYGSPGSWMGASYEPITQFYSVDVSQQDPTRVVGGTQDNGCLRSWGGEDWSSYGCGDGLQTLINYENHDIFYGCQQYGGCFRRGGGSFGTATSDRRGWFTALEFAPNDPDVMYYGGNILNRTTEGGGTWTVISPDLTGGPGNAAGTAYPNFGTIQTVAVAKTDPNTIFLGTDSGRVWYTNDLGENWIRAGEGSLPERWVTRVAIDPTDASVAYATFSGFWEGSDTAHVFRTRDGGVSWEDISGNLPNAPVNDILVLEGALIVATDVGVYLSRDVEETPEGRRWLKLGAGPPVVPVTDMRLQAATDSLYVATYGRGIYRVDLSVLVLPGVNGVPEALDDTAAVQRGQAVDVAVLANDSDPDNDTLTVSSFTQGANGTVTQNQDGTLRYQHDGSQTTSDSFGYTISDGNGGSDSATVRVTVEQPAALGTKTTGGGWLADSQGKKLNFGFEAEQTSSGLEGDLRLNDKPRAVKIDITELSFLGAVGEGCGSIGAGPNALELRGSGSFNGTPGASFRVCVQDNGQGPAAEPDRFYLSCTAGCAYSTATHLPDDTVDGGNIQVRQADTTTTTTDGQAGTTGSESSSTEQQSSSAGAEPTTLILDPLLLSEVLLGQLQTYTITVYDQNQQLLPDATVTLTRTTSTGTQTLTALTGPDGTATLLLTNPAAVTEYIATANDTQSNAIEITPLTQ